MNSKTWVPLGLAIVLGVIAAVAAKGMLNKPAGNVEQNANLSVVAIVKRSIAPGDELRPEDLGTAKVEAGAVPEGSFNDPSALVGRVAQVPLTRGQAVVEPLLAPLGTAGGLQALVPEGMRAITIEVNEFSSVAGLVVPGCRVDVVATIQGDQNTGMMARAVVENVKVQAIGQRMTKPASGARGENGEVESFRSVTLLVTPEQAEAIELAAAGSRPRLVLRNGNDNSPGNTQGVTMADLRGRSMKDEMDDPFATTPQLTPSTQPSEQTTRRPSVVDWTVKVIRGGVESEVTMPLRVTAESALMSSSNIEK
jgi:pilus assembly protein CpaB